MNTYNDNTSTTFLKICEKKYRSYTFGSLSPLDNATLDHLVEIFQHQSDEKPEHLEGRAVPRFSSIPEAGPVVIKSYKRGGWVSRVNHEKYVRTLKTRSRKEFESLLGADEAGVSVPVPVAYASQGRLFYRAWLITKEIPGHISFMQLCLEEKETAIGLIPEISRNIRLLMKKGLHHVDLHPGNIIIDNNRKIYIIDFDKAHYCSSADPGLAGRYQQRWARAIRKYSLPDEFSDLNLTTGNRDMA